MIANWFSQEQGDFPSYVMRDYHKVMDLKYGENPHQRAAYYAEVGLRQHLLSQVTQLHGKQLGFNNLYDLNAARAICDEFTLPCVVIVKHNNPCGCALAESLAAAYDKAYACDPASAFGSVIAVNRTVDVPWPSASASCSWRCCSRPATTTRPWPSSRASRTYASCATRSGAR